MSEEFQILAEVEDRVLFPLKPKFSEVCGCNDCMKKIELLQEFEEEMRSIRKLVQERSNQFHSRYESCISNFQATSWTKRLLDHLQKNLKIVYKKLGVSSVLEKSESEEELRDTDDQMAKLVTVHELIRLNDVSDNEKENADILPLGRTIQSGFSCYRNTKLKDESIDILNDIKAIEEKHEQDKKYAEECKKPLDPSISKKFLEYQIKLVKKLRVSQLLLDSQELVEKIIPKDEHIEKISSARHAIYEIYYAMIKIRRAFWRQYALSDPLTCNDDDEKHNLSGLKESLESLCKEAASFRELWKKNYVSYFTHFERTDPKRQMT